MERVTREMLQRKKLRWSGKGREKMGHADMIYVNFGLPEFLCLFFFDLHFRRLCHVTGEVCRMGKCITEQYAARIYTTMDTVSVI